MCHSGLMPHYGPSRPSPLKLGLRNTIVLPIFLSDEVIPTFDGHQVGDGISHQRPEPTRRILFASRAKLSANEVGEIAKLPLCGDAAPKNCVGPTFLERIHCHAHCMGENLDPSLLSHANDHLTGLQNHCWHQCSTLVVTKWWLIVIWCQWWQCWVMVTSFCPSPHALQCSCIWWLHSGQLTKWTNDWDNGGIFPPLLSPALRIRSRCPASMHVLELRTSQSVENWDKSDLCAVQLGLKSLTNCEALGSPPANTKTTGCSFCHHHIPAQSFQWIWQNCCQSFWCHCGHCIVGATLGCLKT